MEQPKGLRGRRALITGGAGFIGSHIAEQLIEAGASVRVFDNLSQGRLENLAQLGGRAEFVKGDVRRREEVGGALKGVEIVFHMAAQTSVPLSNREPILDMETNVAGTLNILSSSRESRVERVVYASSAAVYGEQGELPLREDLAPNPASCYGVSKLAGEKYCVAFHRVHGLETVCLRYFNVYGPRQSPGPYASVALAFADKILRGEPPVVEGDGNQTRDFVYIRDAARASLLSAAAPRAAGEVINIGSGVETSILNLLNQVAAEAGRRGVEARYAPPRPGDIRRSFADIGKARRLLGYKPGYSLGDGLRELIEWRKKRIEAER